MKKLPRWMRVVMLTTAVLNVFGAITFLPAAGALREQGGLPVEAPPIYLAMLSLFILVFGLAYLWIAFTGKADILFVTVAAAGKLAFFGLLVIYWMMGAVPAAAISSGMGDLVIGSLFLLWVVKLRSEARCSSNAAAPLPPIGSNARVQRTTASQAIP